MMYQARIRILVAVKSVVMFFTAVRKTLDFAHPSCGVEPNTSPAKKKRNFTLFVRFFTAFRMTHGFN
jgi:hypothetical protein